MRKLLLLVLVLPGCLRLEPDEPVRWGASAASGGDVAAGLSDAADVVGADSGTVDSGPEVAIQDSTGVESGSDVGIQDASEAPLVLGISVNGAAVQGFSPDKLSYAVKVGIGTQTASVTVDAPEGVTLTANGQGVQAGQPSAPFALNLGANVFTVTASAAGQTQVYSVTVTRGLAGQEAYVKASNTGKGDRFGDGVAISGDTLVVGALYEDSKATGIDGNHADNSAKDSGAAYVFVRGGTVWSQQAYLKASNTGSFDHFGWSVAIDSDTVIVGAVGESSKATGVDGDQGDDSAAASGAAYVFVRKGTVWSQQAYLKASNTGAQDWFGRSVAIDGDTVVVGANLEGSKTAQADGGKVDCAAVQAAVTDAVAKSVADATLTAGFESDTCKSWPAGSPKPAFCNYRLYGSVAEDYPATWPKPGYDTANPLNGKPLYACAIKGVLPSRWLTWFQAQAACGASGRHLITNGEWQLAVRGTFDPGANDGGVNAKCNSQSAGPRKTGSGGSPGSINGCTSLAGVEDGIGNLWEWVDLWGQAGPVGVGFGQDQAAAWPAGYGGDKTWNVNGTAWDSSGYKLGIPAAAARGGDWAAVTDGGAFALYLHSGPSNWSGSFGFRCAASSRGQ